MYNILNDKLIRMDSSGGSRVEASLPEVYAALMANEVEAFPALRPHQQHAWHAFLVQLGTMAMHKAGLGTPPVDATEWAYRIRGLTPDFPDDEPWQLVVDDITKPAFMQPPVSSEDRGADYKSTVGSPDELDMLVTSKNHDLKAAVASSAEVDDWVFALVTLQTMEGFSGQGNYGISRMNGGLGCRPAFSLTPSSRPGIHARRDTGALLERREKLLEDLPLREGGADLLWTRAWDGTKVEALTLSQLDPLYIEVCRRVRLRLEPGEALYATRATSRAARIEAKALNGRTGDPWTPINRKEGKSLTLASGGFTYKRTAEYLTSSNWELPILFAPTDSEIRSPGAMQLVARAMVRGQGKTEGYYERTVPIRRKLQLAVMRRTATDDLARIANKRIEEVGKVQRILSHAIQVFLARGETDKISAEHRSRTRPWLNRLDEMVDARFFEDLQSEYEASENKREGVHNGWLMNDDKNGVVDRAREILAAAMDSLPCPEIERYKARVGAEGLFEGRIRGSNGLPFLFTERGDDDDR